MNKTVTAFMRWRLMVVLMLCCANVHSQQHLADTTGNSYRDGVSKSYQSKNELFLSQLKTETTDKKLYKHYEASYKAIFKMLHERIKEGELIHMPEISAALEKMLVELKKKNPIVPDDIQILLLRDDLPNAYTLGDNSIFVTLGLLAFLENEDQVAGVLCHEIGHLLMEHTLKAMSYNYERDKESVADAKSLQQLKMKKSDRAFELVKNSIYKGGKISRLHEMQADSCGYALFKNTEYRKTAFVEALDIVGRHDTLRPDGLAITTYKHLFDLPNQPFQEKWLQSEDFSSYNYGSFTEKFNKDSILSHPKSNERIEHLKTLFPELVQTENTSKIHPPESFSKTRLTAQLAHIPTLFFKEQYGIVIFSSLLHLQDDHNDTFYKDWLGKGFQKIYEARRDYQLNRYLDRVSPKDQSKSYSQFLSFMWNLKLEEIKNIADFYSKKGQ